MDKTNSPTEFDKKLEAIHSATQSKQLNCVDFNDAIKQAIAIYIIDEVEDIDLSKSAKSRWGVRARNRARIEIRKALGLEGHI